MNEIWYESISTGRFLRKLRKARRLGRDNIANLTGLDVVYLQLIERGKVSISQATLMKYCNALEVPIEIFEEYQL